MKRLPAPATLLLLSLTACTHLGPVRQYQVLGNSPAVVQAAFNADAGKARVLMLVSPTCPVCLWGASRVSGELLKIEHGKDVGVFVVWVPRLGAKERNVSSATRVVATSWAQQYWDGNDLLGEQYRKVLGWREDAWDVYMLYGPKVRWTGPSPPTPDFFMHQTDQIGPWLDAAVFGSRVEQLSEEP